MSLIPTAVNISLHTLTRHRKGTGKWGKAEPYLWTIFFRVDGEHITISPQIRLEGKAVFCFTEGSHGNLGAVSIGAERVLSIPPSIGDWSTILFPFKIPHFEQFAPGVMGAVCILMEQNNLSYKGAEAGHRTVNQLVEKAVNEAIAGFDPRFIDINDVQGGIRRYFEQKVQEFTKNIEYEVVESIKREQSLLRNLWSLVNADNLIGFHVWNFNQEEIVAASSTGIAFQCEWISPLHGHWEVNGNIRIDTATPLLLAPPVMPQNDDPTSDEPVWA